MLPTEKITSVVNPTDLTKIADAKALDLGKTPVSDEMITNLVASNPLAEKLTILDISGLTQKGLSAISGFKNLNALALGSNGAPQVSPDDLKALVKSLPGLQSLELLNGLEGLTSLELLKILKSNSALQTINLGDNKNLSAANLETLKGYLPNLQTITSQGTNLLSKLSGITGTLTGLLGGLK
jgi:hypothetical protein